MNTIEKTIKVLEANRAEAMSRRVRSEARSEIENASFASGEISAYGVAIAMLENEQTASDYFRIWFGEEAANVEMP